MRSLDSTLLVVAFACAACGDNATGPLAYTNPAGGKLRLVTSATPPASEQQITLDFVVGDQPLTGASAGFNLPVAAGQLRLVSLVPGTALAAGALAPATGGATPTEGPLADHLVVGIAQRRTEAAADATLPAKAVLFTLTLELGGGATSGVVFDGTAAGFVLPSGGMRDRTATTVVDATEVAIGKLEIHR